MGMCTLTKLGSLHSATSCTVMVGSHEMILDVPDRSALKRFAFDGVVSGSPPSWNTVGDVYVEGCEVGAVVEDEGVAAQGLATQVAGAATKIHPSSCATRRLWFTGGRAFSSSSAGLSGSRSPSSSDHSALRRPADRLRPPLRGLVLAAGTGAGAAGLADLDLEASIRSLNLVASALAAGDWMCSCT